MPFVECPGRIPETTKDIGADIGLAARSMSENSRNIQWMETRERNHAHANLHGSARQLAWLDFATCMVGLRNLHGSARRNAWLDFPKCMVQLPALHPMDTKAAPDTRSSHLATAKLRKVQHDNFAPPKIPAKGLILLRQSDSSKDLDGAKDAGRNKRIGWLRIIARLVENPRLAILLRLSEIVDHTVAPRVRDYDAQTVPSPAHKL